MSNKLTEKTINRRQVLKATGFGIGAGIAAPALLLSNTAFADEITLTFWSSIDHSRDAADLFEKAHPGIKIDVQNAGSDEDYYLKLHNLIKAGSGLPDVGWIEYAYMPAFFYGTGLLNLSDYGADAVLDKYVDWAPKLLQRNGKMYGMPWDATPMGLNYRDDIFKNFNLSLPQTWEDMRTLGRALKNQSKDVRIVDAVFGDGSWVTAMLVQAGWKPFTFTDTTATIRMTDPVVDRFCEYWQSMLDEDLVGTMMWFTPEWSAAHDKGLFATWPIGSWGANVMAGFVDESKGKWRVAPMPQWDPNKKIDANIGGSSYAVFTQTKHPKEAAEFAIWSSSNVEVATMFNQKAGHFPVVKAVQEAPGFLDVKSDWFGGQMTNRIYAEAVKEIDTSFVWSPFTEFIFSKMSEELAGAAAGQRKLAEGFKRLQDEVSDYVTDQGFTVVK